MFWYKPQKIAAAVEGISPREWQSISGFGGPPSIEGCCPLRFHTGIRRHMTKTRGVIPPCYPRMRLRQRFRQFGEGWFRAVVVLGFRILRLLAGIAGSYFWVG